jgi:hypothetical protein
MRVTELFARSGLAWESIVNWYQDSLIHELLSYFSERYFSVSFHIYEHIPLGPSANGSAQLIIVAVMLGLIFASVVMAIEKAKHGRFVKKLLRGNCLSPENSKTLTELEEFRNSFVRRAFFAGNALTKCVYCIRTPEALNETVESEAHTDDVAADAEESEASSSAIVEMSERRAADRVTGGERLDYTVARFYIPEDLKYRAELRFESKGSGWLPILLTAILSVVGAALICRFLPDFIQLLDNLISMTAPQ